MAVGYDPLAQKMQNASLAQASAYRDAKSRELDADAIRRDSQAENEATGGHFLFGGFSQAPASGYSDEAGYTQGMADKRTIAGYEGGGKPLAVNASYAGTDFARRPSIAALRGGGDEGDLGGYVPGMNAAINSRDVAPTFEQRRQGAIIAGADARAGRDIDAEDAENNASFDLGSGRAAARARMAGDIQDESRMGDARLGSDIYFDPKVSAQRGDEFFNRMEELRRRYTDPAMVKGQSDIAAAQARGAYGVQRQDLQNQGNLAVQGSRNEGNQATANTRARASVGAAVAGIGGDPRGYIPNAPAAAGPAAAGGRSADLGDAGMTISPSELQEFASSNGLTSEQAQQLAQQHGYSIRDPFGR